MRPFQRVLPHTVRHALFRGSEAAGLHKQTSLLYMRVVRAPCDVARMMNRAS